jgi:hypothetical protein
MASLSLVPGSGFRWTGPTLKDDPQPQPDLALSGYALLGEGLDEPSEVRIGCNIVG